MLVKVKVLPAERASVTAIVDIFRANIIDVGKESMIIELTGNKSKLEAFIDLLDGYEILEIARTGIAGLSRGADDNLLILPRRKMSFIKFRFLEESEHIEAV